MTVLILADEFDVSADQMVLALREREVPMCRVDTAWFPAQLRIDAELRGGRWQGRLRAPGREVELEALRSIWYRSPTTFQFPPELSGAERQHAFLEAKYGFGGVLLSLPVLWVNHPARAAAASKPVQLATATRCGLTVPDTLITNEPDAVRRFAAQGATITWEHPAFWFFAHTALPPGTSYSLRGEHPGQPPGNTVLHSPDGSWCEVRADPDDGGIRRVWEAGPHPLWRVIEDSHAAWVRLGHPEWERFGLTATPGHQRIWLDTPDSAHNWVLG